MSKLSTALIARRRGARSLATITCLSLVAVMLPGFPAAAQVSSTADQMQQVAAPPSVKPGMFTNGTKIRVFDEQQGFTLTAALPINLQRPGDLQPIH